MESTSAQERFTRLLIEHEPELLRCILVAVPNRPDARDILQDCSVSLWRKFDTFDPNKPFVPWALGFVRIEIRRFLRETSRQAKLSEHAVESLCAANSICLAVDETTCSPRGVHRSSIGEASHARR